MRAVTKRILALVLTLAMILSLGLTVQAVGSPVSIELNGTAMELTARRISTDRTGPRCR